MKKRITLIVLMIVSLSLKVQSQDTFSIVAVDPVTGEVGSAGASCVDLTSFPGFSDDFLGELFPGVGAINTQASYSQANQANARTRMNLGETPSQIIQWLINNDVNNQPQVRQYGIAAIVNGLAQTDAHTGTATLDYKNHITGPNYSIQGNILLGPEVLSAMETGFLNAEGDLACKLMAAMQGANIVGADSRCTANGTSSLFAFIKVAQPSDSFGNPSFLQSVRTANGDGVEPIDSLQTLFDANHPDCSALSIDEQEIDSQFSFYPNPVDNFITFINTSSESYKLEIIDIKGRTVKQMNLYNTLKMDASIFSTGFYFIRVSNENQILIKKMIKN